MNNIGQVDSIYTDGSYLSNTGGTWHLEDSALKAQWIVEMLAQYPECTFRTVCEVGCGAGGNLANLQARLPPALEYTGYDISPQAHALSAQFANDRCRFVLGDGLKDGQSYDLVLAVDVVEHIDDCYAFMRQCATKGRWVIYHIPLDTAAIYVLRGVTGWDSSGHIHLFTIENALKAVEHTGCRVVGHRLTRVALEAPGKERRSRAMNLLRRLLEVVSVAAAARILGGYSILILGERAISDFGVARS